MTTNQPVASVPYLLTDAGRVYATAAREFEQADARLNVARHELDNAQAAYQAALGRLKNATQALTEAARGSDSLAPLANGTLKVRRRV